LKNEEIHSLQQQIEPQLNIKDKEIHSFHNNFKINYMLKILKIHSLQQQIENQLNVKNEEIHSLLKNRKSTTC
jgi:hypothetical protein